MHRFPERKQVREKDRDRERETERRKVGESEKEKGWEEGREGGEPSLLSFFTQSSQRKETEQI